MHPTGLTSRPSMASKWTLPQLGLESVPTVFRLPVRLVSTRPLYAAPTQATTVSHAVTLHSGLNRGARWIHSPVLTVLLHMCNTDLSCFTLKKKILIPSLPRHYHGINSVISFISMNFEWMWCVLSKCTWSSELWPVTPSHWPTPWPRALTTGTSS